MQVDPAEENAKAAQAVYGNVFMFAVIGEAYCPHFFQIYSFFSVADPELLPGFVSGIIVLDPAKNERADK